MSTTPYHLTDAYRRARREKYAADSSFRDECIARATETRKRTIRESNRSRCWRARLHRRAANPEQNARVYTARIKGKEGPIKAYSLPALAEMVERRPETLRQWIAEGRFPAPVVEVADLTLGRTGHVYTMAQAARIAKAFAEHVDGPHSKGVSFSSQTVIALMRCV